MLRGRRAAARSAMPHDASLRPLPSRSAPSAAEPRTLRSRPPGAGVEAFRPVSARTVGLGAVGLVTAIPPWWIAADLPSAVGHAVLGVAILLYGTWGMWRPLVELEGDALRYRPRLTPGRGARLSLSRVEAVLPVPRTGHAPSERDLAAWLGLRLSGGAVCWLDLTELRPAARRRVRARVAERVASETAAGDEAARAPR